MEELNKTQLVLLMLFVSFVTSIATGIVTVTLLEQAPQSVTQTINRVVERTVEKVVPGPGATTTITTVKQVVVSEDDLIIQAVKKTSPALVRIRIPGAPSSEAASATTTDNLAAIVAVEDEPTPDVFLTGVTISEGGRIIAAPSGLLGQKSVGKEFLILFAGTETERKAELTHLQDEQNLAVFEIIKVKDSEKFAYIPFPANSLSLGQTLILMDLTSGAAPTVQIGRISEFRAGNASTTPVVTTTIETTSRILGDPLIDTNGSFAGFLRRSNRIMPFDSVKMAIDKAFTAAVDRRN